MAINAVIKRMPAIIANTVPLTTSQSNPPIELRNNAQNLSQNYLEKLFDVDANGVVDGDTLVYNANTHKYVVQPITIGSALIDGGIF
jgi:endonuclease YncB( thermonuclease family)